MEVMWNCETSLVGEHTKSAPRAVLKYAVSPSPAFRDIRIYRGSFAVHPCLYTRQFNQAWAVSSPASLQILWRRNHARYNASASEDNTTVMYSPVSSKVQCSKSEKTARGLSGPSPDSRYG